MKKSFSDLAWAEYQTWLKEDRRILKRINDLLNDIDRNGHSGIGKPEALRYDLSGYWSRRIDDEHRLIYRIVEDEILIISCRGHYR